MSSELCNLRNIDALVLFRVVSHGGSIEGEERKTFPTLFDVSPRRLGWRVKKIARPPPDTAPRPGIRTILTEKDGSLRTISNDVEGGGGGGFTTI